MKKASKQRKKAVRKPAAKTRMAATTAVADPNELKIKVPSGMKLGKPTRRKTNVSKTIAITINKNTKIVEIVDEPPVDPPPIDPPLPAPSPDKTRGQTYTDNAGGVFTLIGTSIYRNGVIFHDGGWARGFLWLKGIGYHEGAGKDRIWYVNAEGWPIHGPNDPETGIAPPVEPPPPPPPPTPGGLRSIITTGSIDAGTNKLKIGG